ncbi:unnamed protein product, partial [Meganyctiphanes norvegica]
SKLWKNKKSENHWDEPVGEEDLSTWHSLSKELNKLDELEFPRFTLSEDKPTTLILYCDASKSAFGYVGYAVQEGTSCNLLAKTKVAPVKNKTLPTLELMAVSLAYKALFNIFKTYKNVRFSNVFVASDAQIIISWLLSDTVKTKNLFARNRIKDVHRMHKELIEEFKVPIQIKYVATHENPGDLITRGLSRGFQKAPQLLD